MPSLFRFLHGGQKLISVMKRTFLNCLDRLNCLDLSRHHSRFRRLNRLNRLDFLLKPARLLALSCLLLALQGSPSAQDTDWRTLIEEWRTTLDVPGMSVGIIRDGQVVF